MGKAAVQDKEDAELLAAAASGNVEECKKWLDAVEDLDGDGMGADVNAKLPGDDGMSSLMLACQNSKTACAKMLIEYGASVNARSGFLKPPKKGMQYTGRWRTALHFAAEAGDAETVSLLLDHVANIHIGDKEGSTPFMIATGAAKDVLGKAHKEELFHMNATEGNVGAMESLLEVGWAEELSGNEEFESSRQLLMRASGDNAASADAILSSPSPPGVLIGCVNGWGENALHFACGAGKTNAVKMLLPRLRDVSPKSVEQPTKAKEVPLHFAAMKGHCAAAKELLVSDDQFARWEGAEVNVQNEFGFTSLALAAKYGHTAMARLLLSYGAAIDARNVDGFTALILASEAGHVPMVRLLKTSGADIECKMDWGKTAVDYARDFGHADIMAILNDEEGIDPKLRKK